MRRREADENPDVRRCRAPRRALVNTDVGFAARAQKQHLRFLFPATRRSSRRSGPNSNHLVLHQLRHAEVGHDALCGRRPLLEIMVADSRVSASLLSTGQVQKLATNMSPSSLPFRRMVRDASRRTDDSEKTNAKSWHPSSSSLLISPQKTVPSMIAWR